MFRSVYSESLCCSVYCLCVNVYWTAATGSQPNCSKIHIIQKRMYKHRVEVFAVTLSCWKRQTFSRNR
jgi:hypothetical protein